MMIRFNLFVASGLIASLLSSIGSVGVYADESAVPGEKGEDYMYIKKSEKSDGDEGKGISVGKVVTASVTGLLTLGASGVGGYYFYKKGHKKVPDRSFDPHRMVLYTFDKGKKQGEEYEVLDFNLNVLKTFNTDGERWEFLNENGLSITGHILDYGGVDGLVAKRREVVRRSDEEWNEMYGDVFGR